MARLSQAEQKKLACARIRELFALARKMYVSRPDRAARYVQLARRISTRIKVRIPLPERRQYCKSCNSLFVPGKSVRIRKQPGRLVYTCLSCGSIKRFGLSKKK